MYSDSYIPMHNQMYVDCDGITHRRFYIPETVCGISFLHDLEGRVSTYHYDLEVTCFECLRKVSWTS